MNDEACTTEYVRYCHYQETIINDLFVYEYGLEVVE
jgi:hypothetical protein